MELGGEGKSSQAPGHGRTTCAPAKSPEPPPELVYLSQGGEDGEAPPDGCGDSDGLPPDQLQPEAKMHAAYHAVLRWLAQLRGHQLKAGEDQPVRRYIASECVYHDGQLRLELVALACERLAKATPTKMALPYLLGMVRQEVGDIMAGSTGQGATGPKWRRDLDAEHKRRMAELESLQEQHTKETDA